MYYMLFYVIRASIPSQRLGTRLHGETGNEMTRRDWERDEHDQSGMRIFNFLETSNKVESGNLHICAAIRARQSKLLT